MRFMQVASRAFGTPLLLAPKPGLLALDALGGYLHRRMREDGGRGRMRMDDDGWGDPPPRTASLPFGIFELGNKPFAVIDGVALILVEGTLVNRLGSLEPYCGMTGYDGLRTQITGALQDPAVKAIVLYVDSPGGEVAGCFDLADFIFDARAVKPVYSIVDGLACSAAYALASATSRIAASETAIVGSIGVIVGHCDFSAMLDKAGIKVTLIYAGEQKAAGNPYEALPEETRAEIQAEIETVYSMFVDRVARYRGLGGDAVRATQSRSYLAGAATGLGLSDIVAPPTDALAAIIQSLE